METPAFIHEVAERLGSDDGRAAAITAAVLHELRDRLTERDAPRVPVRITRALMPLWTEIDRQDRTVERPYRLELLGDVMERGALPDSAAAERAVVAVFAVLRRLLDGVATNARVVPKMVSVLPPDLQFFWAAAEPISDDVAAAQRPRSATPRRRAGKTKRASWSSAA